LDDRVQKGLDAFVAQGGSAQDRNNFQGDRRLAQRRDDLRRRRVLPGQVNLRQFIVAIGQGLYHFFPLQRGGLGQILRDFADGKVRSLRGLIPDQELAVDQVHHTLKRVLASDRNLHGDGKRAKTIAHHLHDMKKIRADPVHLVDEGNLGNAVFVRLSPDGFGLGLDAGNGAENHHRAVQDTQGPLHLNGKIHVPRRINDMNLGILPGAGGHRGGNGDAPLLLLGHPVHDRFAVMHFAHFIGFARIKKNPLADGGFSRVDVGDNADVARA